MKRGGDEKEEGRKCAVKFWRTICTLWKKKTIREKGIQVGRTRQRLSGEKRLNQQKKAFWLKLELCGTFSEENPSLKKELN